MFYKKKGLKKILSCVLLITTLILALPTVSVPASADSILPRADAPFANGTFYISSKHIGNFVQIDDNEAVGTEGAGLEMWNFSGSDVQKWRFTHLGNSCFKIENVASGKALAVNGNSVTNGERLVQKNYVNDPTMQWYVYQSGNYFKIKPMFSNLVMAIGGGIGSNGRNVVQSSTADEYQWYIYSTQTYKYLNLPTIAYYASDCGYTATQLAAAYQSATAKFISTFNISFQAPSFIRSEELNCPTDCDTYNEPRFPCSSVCGSAANCNSLHHKSAYKILNMSETSGKYFCRFTNHYFCQCQTTTSLALGVSYRNSKKSAVSTCDGLEQLTTIIQHELSHNLGTMDGSCSSGQCVMKGNTDKWCSNCKALIKQNY